tara:strand:+ start:265 stop:819 length:555 start_codon:yes stop_codon:yes gene_type:complete
MLKAFILTVFMIFTFAPAHAVEQGPKEGVIIPHDLAVKDQNGKLQSFDQLKGRKGALIVFVRSADWCPFCKSQLRELSTYANQFKILGFPIISVSYDSVNMLNTFSRNNNIKFTMLSDSELEIIKAFDIMNERFKDRPRHFAYGVPIPIIYMVDTKGEILARFYDENYRIRPEVEMVLDYTKGF